MKINEQMSNLFLGLIIIILSAFSMYSSIRFIIKGATFNKLAKENERLKVENNLLRQQLGI